MAFGAALQSNCTGEWSSVTLIGDCGTAPLCGQFCALAIVKVKCAESSDGQPSKSACTNHSTAPAVSVALSVVSPVVPRFADAPPAIAAKALEQVSAEAAEHWVVVDGV